MALVMATALVTGLVVANWTGSDSSRIAVEPPAPPPAKKVASRSPSRSSPVATAPPAVPAQPAVPTQAVIEACNRQAAAQAGPHDKTLEVVKDGAIGAALGAAVGAAGGAIAGGGKGAGKGAAIGGLVGAGGGALYGLNENKKNDQRYRDAYASCMRSRGYTG
jgi:hypothetical protein